MKHKSQKSKMFATSRALALVLVAALSATSAWAQALDQNAPRVPDNLLGEEDDFRVNYKLTDPSTGDILTNGKTLFYSGNVYDFIDESQEVVVFNPKTETFYLVDLARKRKLVVAMPEVTAYAERLRQWGVTHADEDVKLFFTPDFKVTYDSQRGEYTFASTLYTYRVTTLVPARDEILRHYRHFARCSCQFNMMISPGSKTLFARAQVNETVFNAGALVNRIQLTLRGPRVRGVFAKPVTFVSEYQYLPRLVESDRDLAHQTDGYLASFPEMTLMEYRAR